MSSFNQWRIWAARNDIRKVIFVCGPEPFLVEQVVSDVRAIVSPSQVDSFTFQASSVSADAVWLEALHPPLDYERNKLVVVREAEAFQGWNRLPDWLSLSRNMPANYLLFVSHGDLSWTDEDASAPDHVSLIQSKGRFVRCTPPAEEDIANWLISDYDLSYLSADFLVRHASGNIGSMVNLCRKAKLFSASPSPSVIMQLCEEESSDSFVDSLVCLDKKSAYLALPDILPENYSRQISLLDSRLELLQDISALVSKHMGLREICAEQGMKPFLVRKFLPFAKRYTDAKILHCRKVLALIDSSIQAGARKGTLESLIMLW